MKPGTPTQRAIAVLLLAGAVVYLVPFVPRGWFPHDEGMIGQSAERVLRGALPHIGYEEPYTGGLTWLYAQVFRYGGIDLANLRWLLFAAAAFAQVLVYSILRRHLGPVAAALATWLALAWSFPNYFAGLPSWWVLVCALSSLWALIRYFETRRLHYVALAGLAVGIAVVVKQTGIYLVPPLVMSVWVGSAHRRGSTLSPALRALVGLGSLAFAVLILRTRLWPAEIIYLVVPIAAMCLAFVRSIDDDVPSDAPSFGHAMGMAAASAALPLIVLLIPYASGGHLGDFVNGALLLPQKRLSFASMALPPALYIVTGPIVVLTLAVVFRRLSRGQGRAVEVARWAVVPLLVWWSLSSAQGYQGVWQSARSVAALLPVISLLLLMSGRLADAVSRRGLFAAGAMLAWASLVQFPFGAPIYFCYVTPLAVIAAAAIIDADVPVTFRSSGPWAALLVGFAILSMNRSYPGYLGLAHQRVRFSVPLELPRASLKLTAVDVGAYRRTVEVIQRELRGGTLVAGPDCPEIYFLTGQFNESGSLFDFFKETGAAGPDWFRASVVVVNRQPGFSPPVGPALVRDLRRAFPHGETVGRFEVRWR